MLAFLVCAGDSNFTVAVTMPIEMERELRKARNNGERRLKKKGISLHLARAIPCQISVRLSLIPFFY